MFILHPELANTFAMISWSMSHPVAWIKLHCKGCNALVFLLTLLHSSTTFFGIYLWPCVESQSELVLACCTFGLGYRMSFWLSYMLHDMSSFSVAGTLKAKLCEFSNFFCHSALYVSHWYALRYSFMCIYTWSNYISLLLSVLPILYKRAVQDTRLANTLNKRKTLVDCGDRGEAHRADQC